VQFIIFIVLSLNQSAVTRCIIVFVFLCSSVFAQTIRSDKVDDFSKKRTISTNAYEGRKWRKADFIDDKNQMLASMSYTTGREFDLYFLELMLLTTSDFGCLSNNGGKVLILFENDSTMELYQSSDTDCDNNSPSAVYAMLSRDDLEKVADPPTLLDETLKKLQSNLVKKIRVYGTKGFRDFTIKPEKKSVFTTHINLIKNSLRH
jgi:predicted metallo-beta-lactamase superfamily hydrolase